MGIWGWAYTLWATSSHSTSFHMESGSDKYRGTLRGTYMALASSSKLHNRGKQSRPAATKNIKSCIKHLPLLLAHMPRVLESIGPADAFGPLFWPTPHHLRKTQIFWWIPGAFSMESRNYSSKKNQCLLCFLSVYHLLGHVSSHPHLYLHPIPLPPNIRL